MQPNNVAIFSIVHLCDTNRIQTSAWILLPMDYGKSGFYFLCIIMCALPLAVVTT